MLGISINSSTNTNDLHLNIPDELKGINLQIIILPAAKATNQQIEFFTNEDLIHLSKIELGSPVPDNEDYTKW